MDTSERIKNFDFTLFENRRPFRSFLSIFISWTVIALAIYTCFTFSFWFYPIVILIIANRQLALMLLSHEGLHGNLFTNKRLNDFIARYFCAFPTFISLSRYRKKHLIHHAFLNTPADPDLGLYIHYPQKKLSLLHPRAIYNFLKYYTDLADITSVFYKRNTHKNSLFAHTDTISFIIFHALVFGIMIHFHWLTGYILLWLVPVLFSLPYFIFMGALQHGPQRKGERHLQSRTVIGSKWWMEMLLPVDINFHGEHHLRPTVPHYNLRKLSAALEEQKIILWREPYFEATKKLFN